MTRRSEDEAVLRVLQDAQGDSAQLALATVNVTFPELTTEEIQQLRRALQVAAVPHWCTAAILANLMDVPHERAAESMCASPS